MPKSPKVIVIGLDGATWSILKSWAYDGKLPTIQKLLDNGAWGLLKSTIPAVTFPAWETIFTGQNPADFDVFGFVDIDIKNKEFKINTPNAFKSKPLWKILNKYGYVTCMINIPTSKVQKVKGAIIGGPFSEDKSVYPPYIKHILEKINYVNYPQELSKAFMESYNRKPPLNLIRNVISTRFRLAKYLINTYEPDFLALVIFIIDNIQHFYWDTPFVYDSWKIIDDELNDFISNFKDSIILLVSDHGFTTLRKTFYISKFLERIGLLKYKQSLIVTILNKLPRETIINFISKFKINRLTTILPKKVLLLILHNLSTKEGGLGVEGLKRIIDWKKSKCISIGTAIYLNCTEKEKVQLKYYLKSRLMRLKGIVKNVYFKEDIYHGKYFEHAPDIVIEPEEGVRILENPYSNVIVSTRQTRGWKGDHAPQGIFLFYGPNIKKIKELRAEIYDITPTILALYGIKPQKHMTGKILTEIFKSRTKIEVRDNVQTSVLRQKISVVKNKLKNKYSTDKKVK